MFVTILDFATSIYTVRRCRLHRIFCGLLFQTKRISERFWMHFREFEKKWNKATSSLSSRFKSTSILLQPMNVCRFALSSPARKRLRGYPLSNHTLPPWFLPYRGCWPRQAVSAVFPEVVSVRPEPPGRSVRSGGGQGFPRLAGWAVPRNKSGWRSQDTALQRLTCCSRIRPDFS